MKPRDLAVSVATLVPIRVLVRTRDVTAAPEVMVVITTAIRDLAPDLAATVATVTTLVTTVARVAIPPRVVATVALVTAEGRSATHISREEREVTRREGIDKGVGCCTLLWYDGCLFE